MPPLSTVKINELNPLTVGLELDNADKLPIYIASENKTKRVSLQELSNFLITGGGGGSHPPAIVGGEYIYIVPLLADGTQNAYIPSLAGLEFTLERGGMPLIALLPDLSNVAVAEYEILTLGGFKLLQSGDVLATDERFKLMIYSLISTTPGTTPAAAFIRGKKVIGASTPLDPVDDINKIIQIRGADDYITVTIPDLSGIEANGLYVLDASIGQNKPVTVNTTGGQYIYFNKTGKTTIYMMPGEVCWLYRDTDGFYIINDFADHYIGLGNPVAAYKKGLNQLVFNGDELLRADHPRLWEELQTFGSSLVDKSIWETATETLSGRTIERPYRGCWHRGDGSTTFGVPDLMNTFIRGLLSEVGSDSERILNKAGGYQDDMLKAHDHTIHQGNSFTGSGGGGTVGRGSVAPNIFQTDSFGGIETRPGNVGMLWVCNE